MVRIDSQKLNIWIASAARAIVIIKSCQWHEQPIHTMAIGSNVHRKLPLDTRCNNLAVGLRKNVLIFGGVTVVL